jgi:hypothetical protein
MEAERIDAIRAIIGELETLSAAVGGHLQEVRDDTDDPDAEDLEQRLEFAFAELRAARRELIEATKFELSAV